MIRCISGRLITRKSRHPTVFSAAECARLTVLSKDEIALTFFRYWTQREAVMKAVGMGFSLDITALSFNEDGAFAQSSFSLIVPDSNATPVVVKDCPSFSGFCASVARERGLGDLTYFDLDAG